MRLARIVLAALVVTAVACGDDPPAPLPARVECNVVVGLPAEFTRYFVTEMDGAELPAVLDVQGLPTQVAGMQLALSAARTSYFLTFYEPAANRFGGFTTVGETSDPEPDDVVNLFVADDPTLIRGVLTIQTPSFAILQTTDDPSLGSDNLGTHEFLLARCPT